MTGHALSVILLRGNVSPMRFKEGHPMAKQTLGVFTENELDRNYMCKILSQVFSSSLDIVPVTLATVHTLAAEPAAILVNITSLAYADKYFPNSQIIFARRFLDSNHLHRFWNCPKVRQCWLQTSPDGLRRIW